MIDNRTANLNLPLPDPTNLMKSEDVPRIVAALQGLDAAVAARVTPADLDAAINSLIGGAPATLDTLNEIAQALADDANFAATVTSQLALKANKTELAAVATSGLYDDLQGKPATFTPPIASSVQLGGIKLGAGLVVSGDGAVSVAGLGGNGLPAYQDVPLAVTTAGQTSFTPAGGYTAGQIDLRRNGVMLEGGGDDYTASDGTTVTLTVGASTSDTIVMRKWFYLPAANAVNKQGDTMTGYLAVPANASGAQVPQAQEVVKKSGDTMTGPLSVPAGATGTQAPRVQEVVKKSGDTMTGPLSVPAGAAGAQAPQVQEVVKKAGDTMTGALKFPNGSAAAPSIAFASDPTTGLYRVSAGVIGFAVGGVLVATISAAGIKTTGNVSKVSALP